jgi:hypothetical protein
MAGAVASTKAPNTMMSSRPAGVNGHAGSCWILDQFPAVFAATSRTITTAASQMPAGSTSAASTTTSGLRSTKLMKNTRSGTCGNPE